jgi:hypothetical protein
MHREYAAILQYACVFRRSLLFVSRILPRVMSELFLIPALHGHPGLGSVHSRSQTNSMRFSWIPQVLSVLALKDLQVVT